LLELPHFSEFCEYRVKQAISDEREVLVQALPEGSGGPSDWAEKLRRLKVDSGNFEVSLGAAVLRPTFSSGA
jgi:hypothetical protein